MQTTEATVCRQESGGVQARGADLVLGAGKGGRLVLEAGAR